MTNYIEFFNTHWVLTLEFIVILILILINEIYISRDSKHFLPIEKVVEMINHKNAKIFDIRDSFKFNNEHIKNSLNINLLDIQNKEYIVQKNKRNCVIICSDNNKEAKKVISLLKEKGLQEIYILKGGLETWKNAGFHLNKKIINKNNKKNL